jgi:hypothetical protein
MMFRIRRVQVHALFVVAIISFWHYTTIECNEENNNCPSNLEGVEDGSCSNTLNTGTDKGSSTVKSPVVDNNENKDDEDNDDEDDDDDDDDDEKEDYDNDDGKDDDPSCRDDHEDCQSWSQQKPSECEVNPNFMLHECKLACRVCDRQ